MDSSSISDGSSLYTPQSDGNSALVCSSPHLSRSGGDDESFNDQESIGDDEAELQAEELMADDIFPRSPPSYSPLKRRITDGTHQGLQGGSVVYSSSVLEIRRSHSAGIQSQLRPSFDSPGDEDQAVLNQQQLRRLRAYSSLHTDKSNGYGSTGSRGSKDNSGSSYLRNIPGWSHYRSRQSTTSARQMVREVLDHGSVLDDCLGGDETLQTEIRRSECSAWKACFGLFWVAAGHWLDDSRLVSSYNLQPHCLLELQLRNNYIQLPPPGTPLNYYDHYAEGVLYKMSKKSRPVSRLTNNGTKECAGVWKERWVVLQGTKLLVYHKRKDTTKKSIELRIPLTVVTTVLPHIPRHSFKLTSSAAAMSTTIITLAISPDPSVPKVCFRASSESELNHWVRIFNSLNCTPLQGLPPPFDPTAIVSPIAPPISVPPPLPPLPLEPPPASMDEAIMSARKRNRYHSYTAANNPITRGAVFSGVRQRSHTVQSPATLSAINPVLISNAAAALLNLNNHNQSADDNGGRNSRLSVSNSISRSSSIGRNGQVTNGQHQFWNGGQEISPNFTASLLDGRDLSLLQHHSLSRQGSFSAHYQNFGMEGDQRRRMATDPGHGHQMLRIRSLSSRGSSQQLLWEYSLRSKDTTPEPSSDITSIPENALLENEEHSHLDPSSMKLLKSSDMRSSSPPLYSGYIWLYIPNTSAPVSRKEDQSDFSVSNSSITTNPYRTSMPPMSRSHSSSSICVQPTATSPSGSRAANISISKASGRYVKCFVVINALGQFQWVEAKKELELQQEDGKQDSASNPSFGIQLDSKVPSSRDTKAMEHISLSEEERNMVATIAATTEQKRAGPVVQVSMAHKLRLYFFCIKISLSALMEVMVEMTPEPEKTKAPTSSIPGSPPPPPPLNKKSSLRVLNRFSSPLMRKASILSTSSSSTLPPQPIRSTSLTRTRTLSGTPAVVSQDFSKNNANVMWPSMHPLHERPLPLAHTSTTLLLKLPPPMPLERLVPKTHSVQPPSTSAVAADELTEAVLESGEEKMPRSLLVKTQSLFAENRTRSSPPRSILPSVVSPAAVSTTATAAPRTRHSSLSAVLGRATRTFCPFASDIAASSIDYKFQESVDSKPTTHVLALAHGLQKAMQSHGSFDMDSAGVEQQGMQRDHDQQQQKHKISLQEITAKKRASHQQKRQDSENVAATRLKLVGGLKLADSSYDSSGDSEAEKERLVTAAATLKTLMHCPFLEQGESKDAEGKMFVTLKGYTETEDAWKMLQSALERFLDGPIKDQRSALPPEDTLIPSYHAPRLPEIKLSEKAQNFLKAKDRVSAAAASGILGAGTASIIFTTPPTMLAATVNLSGTSSSRSRCMSTPTVMKPAEFNKHSVPLTGGVGYGPGRSLVADLGNARYENNNCGILVAGRTDGVDANFEARLRSGSASASTSGPGLCSGSQPPKMGHRRSGSGQLLRYASEGQQRSSGRSQGQGAVAQIKATSASLTRWMHLSSGGTS
ncbi:hypothetical protein BGZ58_008399 [Dissophora ornata]|nr:hypothetical protein BGZ58_008399 [Dissophora ornata]